MFRNNAVNLNNRLDIVSSLNDNFLSPATRNNSKKKTFIHTLEITVRNNIYTYTRNKTSCMLVFCMFLFVYLFYKC